MTPVLFLPGMMCDAGLYAPQLSDLSDRPAEVFLPVGAASMQDLAKMALAEAPDRFDLVGLSMGGILAMEILAQAPARVRRLCLIATNARAESDAVAAGRQPQLDAVAEGGLEHVMQDQVIPKFFVPGQSDAALEHEMLRQALTLGPDAFVSQSQALMTRPDQRDTLSAVETPTLVMCGEGDQLCPPFRHEEIAGLMRHAQLYVLPGVGHLPTLQAANIVTTLLRDFLDKASES